jgi:hypothetical protein
MMSVRHVPHPSKRSLVVALSLLYIASATPARAEWVLAAFGGQIHTRPSDLRLDQPASGTHLVFPEVPFRGRAFSPPIYYGYRVARSIPGVPWLYAEFEYMHAKVFAKDFGSITGAGTLNGQQTAGVPFPSVIQAYAMSHGLNFFLFNAAVRRPVKNTSLVLSARAGIGPTLPHAETEVDGVRQEGYEYGGIGTELGAGVELRVWSHFGFMAEYKWTHARPEIVVHDGTGQITANTHHLAFGLTAAF